MKTYLLSASLLLLIGVPVLAQVKADRQVGDFNGINLKGAIKANITQGQTNQVSLEADSQEELDALKTEVKDGILMIREDKHGSGNVKINITVKALKEIEVSDATELRSTGPITADEITIKGSGAGDVRMECVAKKIIVTLSGAGDAHLSGTTDMLEAHISGAGDLKAFKLLAQKAEITSSGAGDAKVNVVQSLHSSVSGAGDVVYINEPAEKSVEVSGAGSVRQSHSKSDSGKSSSDTTKLSVGHHKVFICDDDGDDKDDGKDDLEHKFKHWSGLEMGVNGLRSGAKDGMTLPKGSEYMQLDYGKSLSFNLNLFEKDFHLHGEFVNLVTGLGFEFNHYGLQNKVSLRYDSVYTTAKNENNTSFKKNTLNESLLTVPLMLDFNTSSNPDRNFHFSVGVIGAWKIGAKTRQKYMDTDGKEVSLVKSNDYNLNPFRYSLTARVGYKNVGLFAQYAMSEFFKPGHGPELYPVSAGISLHL